MSTQFEAAWETSRIGVPDGEQPAPWDTPQHYTNQLREQGVDDDTATASGWHKAINAWQVGQ